MARAVGRACDPALSAPSEQMYRLRECLKPLNWAPNCTPTILASFLMIAR
jgi:hypothetical protein